MNTPSINCSMEITNNPNVIWQCQFEKSYKIFMLSNWYDNYQILVWKRGDRNCTKTGKLNTRCSMLIIPVRWLFESLLWLVETVFLRHLWRLILRDVVEKVYLGHDAENHALLRDRLTGGVWKMKQTKMGITCRKLHAPKVTMLKEKILGQKWNWGGGGVSNMYSPLLIHP